MSTEVQKKFWLKPCISGWIAGNKTSNEEENIEIHRCLSFLPHSHPSILSLLFFCSLILQPHTISWHGVQLQEEERRETKLWGKKISFHFAELQFQEGWVNHSHIIFFLSFYNLRVTVSVQKTKKRSPRELEAIMEITKRKTAGNPDQKADKLGGSPTRCARIDTKYISTSKTEKLSKR